MILRLLCISLAISAFQVKKVFAQEAEDPTITPVPTRNEDTPPPIPPSLLDVPGITSAAIRASFAQYSQFKPSLFSYCMTSQLEDYARFVDSHSEFTTYTEESPLQSIITSGAVVGNQTFNSASFTTYSTSTVTITNVIASYSFPRSDPCCGKCSMWGDRARVLYWPETAMNNGSTFVSDGYTFISPSPYLLITTLAISYCDKTLGDPITTATVPVRPGGLSAIARDMDARVDIFNVTYPFYSDQLNRCSTEKNLPLFKSTMTVNGDPTSFWVDPCWAKVYATEITNIQPALSICSDFFIDVRDPPIALTAQAPLAPVTPPVVGPTPEPLPEKTKPVPGGGGMTLRPGPTGGPAPNPKPSSDPAAPNPRPDPKPPSNPNSLNLPADPPAGQPPNSNHPSDPPAPNAPAPAPGPADSVNLPSNQPSPPSNPNQPQSPPQPITIDSQTFQPLANGVGLIIGSTTLTPGAPAVTISDQIISLGTSVLVVGTKTVDFVVLTGGSSGGAGKNPGDYVWSGFGGDGALATSGTRGNGTVMPFNNGAAGAWMRGKMWMVIGVMGVGLMMR